MTTSTLSKSKRNSVDVKENHILITNIQQWAILDKRPNANGLQGITFSSDISAKDISIINSSGIAQVQTHNTSGTIAFTRKDFYTNSKMYELIIDILK